MHAFFLCEAGGVRRSREGLPDTATEIDFLFRLISKQETLRQTTLQRHHARTLRRNMTGAERVMWNHLKGRAISGYRFNRQVEIGPFIVDFLCRELKVIVEIDSPSHSGTTTDQHRTAYLEEKGYVVFRAWNNEIYSNLDGVLTGLLLVLESRTR